jgi:hypothetical protein
MRSGCLWWTTSPRSPMRTTELAAAVCNNPLLAADCVSTKAALSDGALVGVAPSRVWVLEQDDDGVVGFFVVCFGVLAG